MDEVIQARIDYHRASIENVNATRAVALAKVQQEVNDICDAEIERHEKMLLKYEIEQLLS